MGIWIIRKRIECALLKNNSISKHKDLVTIPDCAESVCNHDRGTPLHGTFKSLLYDLLTLLIERWSSFIQNQDSWILDQCSCDCDSLLLTSRKLWALQTTWFIEAFTKLEYTFTASHSLDGRLLQTWHTLGEFGSSQASSILVDAVLQWCQADWATGCLGTLLKLHLFELFIMPLFHRLIVKVALQIHVILQLKTIDGDSFIFVYSVQFKCPFEEEYQIVPSLSWLWALCL